MIVDLLECVFSFSGPDASLIRAAGGLIGEGVPDGKTFGFDVFGVLAFCFLQLPDESEVFPEVEFGIEVGSGGCDASYASCCC
jgi:hypothetical protein